MSQTEVSALVVLTSTALAAREEGTREGHWLQCPKVLQQLPSTALTKCTGLLLLFLAF